MGPASSHSSGRESARQHRLGGVLVHRLVRRRAGGGPGGWKVASLVVSKGKPRKGLECHILDRRSSPLGRGSGKCRVSEPVLSEGIEARGMEVLRDIVVV